MYCIQKSPEKKLSFAEITDKFWSTQVDCTNGNKPRHVIRGVTQANKLAHSLEHDTS